MEEQKKILLIHHGGSRGGYGVCWDLCSRTYEEECGKKYKTEDFGLVSPEAFETLSSTKAYTPYYDSTAKSVRICYRSKDRALEVAAKYNLITIAPQSLIKQIREKHKTETEKCNYEWCRIHPENHTS